jgi:lipoprotein-anchoring transpeptidase ErfK/SrfK
MHHPTLSRDRLRASTLLPLMLVALLAACGAREEVTRDPPEVEGYGVIQDGEYSLPAVPAQYLAEPNRRAEVAYAGGEGPGTIVVDPHAKFLYLVGEAGTATRYPIAVGREGKGFSGSATVGDTRIWPGWTPTANMIRREPEVYAAFARGVPGGLASPLGARALYLYRGGRDTRYRIHGTNDLESIGNAGSAGCIRLFNHDIIDLYSRVGPGTSVKVRSLEESALLEPAYTGRGVELPPRIVPADVVYDAVAAQQAAVAGTQPVPEETQDVLSVIN